MTGNRFITKLTTLVFMLVFSQKMGMSLYLHNWLHAATQHSTSSEPVTSQEIQFACGCINDFNLPFIETIVPDIQAPVIAVNRPHATPAFSIPVIYKYYHSLRAPPKIWGRKSEVRSRIRNWENGELFADSRFMFAVWFFPIHVFLHSPLTIHHSRF